MQYKNIEITKYPHSGFRIDWEGDQSFQLSEMTNGNFRQIICIDPFNLPDGQPKADILFISHEHFDHCHPDSIKKILTDNTIVIGNLQVKNALKDLEIKNFREVKVKEQIGINGLIYSTLPAYNTNKFRSPGVVFHPKENGGIGFLLSFNVHDSQNTIKIYHMGDTDFVEDEMKPADINILLIPVSGTYVMTAEEAAKAANIIKPEISIPMHYDAGVVGSVEDVEKFKELVKDSKVEVVEAVR